VIGKRNTPWLSEISGQRSVVKSLADYTAVVFKKK